MIQMILAVDNGNAIGWSDGRLPWKLPADMKRFKTLTSGSTVLMGFNTFKSLGRPSGLPNRKNIVLTRKPWSESREHIDPNSDVDVISSLDWLTNPRFLHGQATACWIIGGASVYDEAIDRKIVDEIYLTLVHENSGADVVMKHDLTAWKLFMLRQAAEGVNWFMDNIESVSPQDNNGIGLTYATLKRV